MPYHPASPVALLPSCSTRRYIVSTVVHGGRLELPSPDAPLPGPGRLPPPLMEAYVGLLRACCAPDKAQRPTFSEVVGRLRRLLDQLSEQAGEQRGAR